MQDKLEQNFIHLGVRVTEEEYKRIKTQAKKRNLSISDYVREMVLNDGCSLLQLRMILSEVENTLANILLGEKIIAANATEMFRNLSTRIDAKGSDPSRMTLEEKEKITKGVENSINMVKTAAMETVFKHYTETDNADPLSLDVFAKKIEDL